MARIFYFADTSVIYGVHPDGNIKVPDDVAFIDVVETPDKVKWPQLPDGRPGNEHTSRVVGGSLAVNPSAIPPPDPHAAFDKAIDNAADTVVALKAVLKGRVAARP